MKWVVLASLVFLTGCMDISPLSPESRIDNQGQIDELKSNQNGLMLDMLNLKQEQEMHARDVDNQIQGMFNKSNSGIQILQGDGALIMIFSMAVVAMILVYHYRTKAKNSTQAAEIMAQQITVHKDKNLENNVFMSALNTDAEEDVYNLMVKAQTYSGRKRV